MSVFEIFGIGSEDDMTIETVTQETEGTFDFIEELFSSDDGTIAETPQEDKTLPLFETPLGNVNLSGQGKTILIIGGALLAASILMRGN